jgi:hypothetical protein
VTQPPSPLGQGRASVVAKSQPTPEPPRPVYQQAATKLDENLIDLSEPLHSGWLDAIAPEPPTTSNNMMEIAPERVSETAEAVQALPATNISIQISMPSIPKFHWPKLPTLPAWPYKLIAVWGAIGAGGLLVLAVGFVLIKHYDFSKSDIPITTGTAALSSALSNPTFVPVAPKNKPQLATGKSQATAFDGHRDTYSYTDNLDNVPLTVSEQPIPANFSSATQAVASIAKSIGAAYTLKPPGTVAYEAESNKTSAQTIVFSADNLLIFIQSNFSHDNGTWQDYIASLQQPAN